VWAKITKHMRDSTVNSECGMPIIDCLRAMQSDKILLYPYGFVWVPIALVVATNSTANVTYILKFICYASRHQESNKSHLVVASDVSCRSSKGVSIQYI
jgi:hypothetical protein